MARQNDVVFSDKMVSEFGNDRELGSLRATNYELETSSANIAPEADESVIYTDFAD